MPLPSNKALAGSGTTLKPPPPPPSPGTFTPAVVPKEKITFDTTVSAVIEELAIQKVAVLLRNGL